MDIMNILIHEYEQFRMKSEENIQDMEKIFILIVNHLRIMDKFFQNKDLINKVLRHLNYSWKLKIIAISKPEDLSSMNLATFFFGKLQKYAIELKRIVENEESDKKKKSIALIVEETK